jgi:hypothetical protein
MRHSVVSCGFVLAVAACSAQGSDSSTHGPVFGDDASSDAASGDASLVDGAATDAMNHDGAASDAMNHDGAASDAANDTTSTTDASMDASSSDAHVDSSNDASSCASTMALVAGDTTAFVAALFSGGQWSTATTLTGSMSAPPAIAAFGSGYVAVAAKQGSTPSLQSTIYTSSWSAPTTIGTLGARDTLGLATVGSNLHLVYLGSADSKFYHGTLTGSTWDGAVDPVGAPQSFGNSGATAAAAGGALVMAQSGSNASVYDQTWSTTWQAAHQETGTSVIDTIAPTLVALSGGAADLLIVYVRPTDFHLMFSTRTSGTWSAPAEVYNAGGNVAYSNDPVSLAPRAGGKAALAFRGGNAAPYYALFDGSAWSAPAAVVATLPTLASPPSIAAGVCGDDATLAYVTSTGDVDVVRLVGTTWSSPTMVTSVTGMTYAAIATRP